MTVFAAPFYVVGTLAAGIAGIAFIIEKPEPARRLLSVAVVAFIAGLPVGVGGVISIGPVSPSFPGWAMLVAQVMLGAIPIAAALAAHALGAAAVDYRWQEWGRQWSNRPVYGRRRPTDNPRDIPDRRRPALDSNGLTDLGQGGSGVPAEPRLDEPTGWPLSGL
jgi:hypothetical protein